MPLLGIVIILTFSIPLIVVAYSLTNENGEADRFFRSLPFLRHKCKNCSYRYPSMGKIKWIADFRTGFHKNPKTGKTCYWMLFKDGSQTYDYPGE